MGKYSPDEIEQAVAGSGVALIEPPTAARGSVVAPGGASDAALDAWVDNELAGGFDPLRGDGGEWAARVQDAADADAADADESARTPIPTALQCTHCGAAYVDIVVTWLETQEVDLTCTPCFLATAVGLMTELVGRDNA